MAEALAAQVATVAATWPPHAIEIIVFVVGGSGVLVGIIYKTLARSVEKLAGAVVYKDTCEVVQKTFTKDIGKVEDAVKDLKDDLESHFDKLSEKIDSINNGGP